ncbi:MAG: hypothetical protein EOO38_21985 [Cytophagaceae bacterium]|nr:MAG: hypothetical protein EOO38_21985 [Cytophagaceae bacterium]
MTRQGVIGLLLTLIVGPILVIVFQKIADSALAPKADLTYYVVSGPAFSNETNSKGLYAITMRNSGSTKLTNVVAKIAFPVGTKLEVASQKAESSAVIKTEQSSVSITSQSLFPDEQEWIGVSATGTTTAPLNPAYSARSDEAKGRFYLGEGRDKVMSPWIVLFGGFGALLGSITAFMVGLKGGARVDSNFAAVALNRRLKLKIADDLLSGALYHKLRPLVLAEKLVTAAGLTANPEVISRASHFIRGLALQPDLRRFERKLLLRQAQELGLNNEDIASDRRAHWAITTEGDFDSQLGNRIPVFEDWV